MCQTTKEDEIPWLFDERLQLRFQHPRNLDFKIQVLNIDLKVTFREKTENFHCVYKKCVPGKHPI